jgi:hypothetical protein
MLFSCAGIKNTGNNGDGQNDGYSVDELPSIEESSVEYMYDSDADGVPDYYDLEPSYEVNPLHIEEYMMMDPSPTHVNRPPKTGSIRPSGNVNGVYVGDSDEISNINVQKITPDVVDFRTGSMVYDIPLNMEVGKSHTVKLRISRKDNKNITVGFTNDTTVYKIETSGVMEVLLFDPNPEGVNKQFEIVNLTDNEQALEDDGRYNEWTWGVTPIRSGEGKLKLIINIKKQTEFGVKKRSITVFEKDIEISSNSKYFIRKFFYDNWEWFASTIAIPFVIFGWKRRDKIVEILKKK